MGDELKAGNNNVFSKLAAIAVDMVLFQRGELMQLYTNVKDDNLIHYAASSRVPKERFQEFIDAMKFNCVVEHLDLSACKINGEKLGLLVSDMLRHNKTVKVINLANNQLGCEGACCIAEVLPQVTSLQKLYLNKNAIGDKGIASILSALAYNSSLRTLDLSDNDFTPIACEPLNRIMLSNATLRTLLLAGNTINSKSMKSLIAIFNACSKSAIEKLSLSRTGLTSKAMQILLSALKENNSVRVLSLAENDFSADTIKAVAEMVKCNYALQDVLIDTTDESLTTVIEQETSYNKRIAFVKFKSLCRQLFISLENETSLCANAVCEQVVAIINQAITIVEFIETPEGKAKPAKASAVFEIICKQLNLLFSLLPDDLLTIISRPLIERLIVLKMIENNQTDSLMPTSKPSETAQPSDEAKIPQKTSAESDTLSRSAYNPAAFFQPTQDIYDANDVQLMISRFVSKLVIEIGDSQRCCSLTTAADNAYQNVSVLLYQLTTHFHQAPFSENALREYFAKKVI